VATRTPRAPASLAAYVLHRYDWSESSLILDLLTREQGRVAVVAKGAKRPHSQLRAVLLPFQRVNVSLGRMSDEEGASEVQTLRHADWAGGGSMLTGAALFSGFYLNELLMKLLARHDAHPVLFDAYAQTIPALAAGNDAQVEAALRAFELLLLREVGLLPELDVVTQTQRPVGPLDGHVLLPEAGVGAGRGDEADLSGTALVCLEAAMAHGSLPALQQACSAVLPALKVQLRALLHYHVGSPMLRTRRVMMDLLNLQT
jgi:DNA repair protein RecO (recombination protein O)